MNRRIKSKMTDTDNLDWLIIYGNLVTLLLVFFVLMYSFSSTDSVKFKGAVKSLSQAFGSRTTMVTETGDSDTISDDQSTIFNDFNSDGLNSLSGNNQTQEMYNQVMEYIKGSGLNADVRINQGIPGVIIEFPGTYLFDSGRADIKPAGLSALDKISNLLSGLSNEIMVEGYTDNIPIHTAKYQNNLELSADRAVKVVQYLTENKHLTSSKLYAVGGGEDNPIADNSTLEGRLKNNRIDILIVTAEGENR